MKTKKLVLCALYSALTFVATMIIQIKLTPNGYVNLGDCMVITGGIFLGPFYGAISAAIASTLADLISGYIIYVPATLTIKAVMAISAAFLYRHLNIKSGFLSILICSLIAEFIMILGYFTYEISLLGIGAALAGMPVNLLQAAFALICSIVLYKVLSKNKYIMSNLSF